jgi:hypothetical protein
MNAASTLPSAPFLHDLAWCMALAQQGVLRCNDRGRCAQSSLRRLRRVVRTTTPNWLSQRVLLQFMIKLLRTGQLIRIQEHCFCLTPAARLWLTQSPTQQLERLRCIWWSVPELAAYKPARSRAHDERSSYWRAMAVEICRWLGALSPQGWTRAAGVHAFLRQRGMGVPRGRSDNLPQVRSARQRRTVLFIGFLLQSVLPSLGLVQCRGAGPDLALRITPEGALWLQAALRSLPAWKPPEVLAEPLLVESASPAETPTRLIAVAAATGIHRGRETRLATDRGLERDRFTACGGLSPSLQQVLPIPQLVAVLPAYQLLRTQVPGLAELGLPGLVHALARALEPADARPMQRLVASQAALVQNRLACSPPRGSAQAPRLSARTGNSRIGWRLPVSICPQQRSGVSYRPAERCARLRSGCQQVRLQRRKGCHGEVVLL